MVGDITLDDQGPSLISLSFMGLDDQCRGVGSLTVAESFSVLQALTWLGLGLGHSVVFICEPRCGHENHIC